MSDAMLFAQDSPLEHDWQRSYCDLKRYVRSLSRLQIATLGPKGTSSEAAAQYVLAGIQESAADSVGCALFATFEQAFEDMRRGASDLFLVANAYDKVNHFYMSAHAALLFSFIHATPLYGIAKRKGRALRRERKLVIATHPAPVSLIPEFLRDLPLDFEVLLTDSTTAAARKVQNDEVALCVTTAPATELYELEFITPTRPIHMTWSLFAPKEKLQR